MQDRRLHDQIRSRSKKLGLLESITETPYPGLTSPCASDTWQRDVKPEELIHISYSKPINLIEND